MLRFKDTGKESEDFYSLFYPTALMTAVQMKYAEEVLNIQDSYFLTKKFLKSKGIFINEGISETDLMEIYSDWLNEFRFRGTAGIYRDKQLTQGRGIRNNSGGSYNFAFKDVLSLGDDTMTITFDWLEKDADLSSQVAFMGMDGVVGKDIYVSYSGGLVFNIFGGLSITLSTDYDDILKTIKITATKNGSVWDCGLSVNGDVITEIPIQVPYQVFSAEYIMGDDMGIISNLRIYNEFISSPDTEYRYRFDEEDGYYFADSIGSENYIYTPVNNDNNIQTEDEFGNLLDYSPVYGELKRLVDYQVTDEFISAKAGRGDLGWLLGESSPMSFQSLGYVNLNKLSNSLSYFPFVFSGGLAPEDMYLNTDGEFIVNFTTSGEKLEIGDNVTATSPIANYITDHVQAVSKNLNYELSFNIEMPDDSNTILSFGVSCFDENKDKVTTVAIGSNSDNYFFNNSTFFTKFSGKRLLVRGIIYNSDFADTDTRTILGDTASGHLKFDSETVYIRPYLAIERDASGAAEVKISNISLLPLSLPTPKGAIGGKNEVVINYITNNSGTTIEQINRNVESLFPYNLLIKNSLFERTLAEIDTWTDGLLVTFTDGSGSPYTDL